MLAKKYRIDKQTFKKILALDRKFDSEFVSLKTVSLPDKNQPPLFSFIVPTKTAPKAVLRNKLKRRGRHIVKKHSDSFKKNTATTFFFKKGSERLKFTELEEKILILSERANLL